MSESKLAEVVDLNAYRATKHAQSAKSKRTVNAQTRTQPADTTPITQDQVMVDQPAPGEPIDRLAGARIDLVAPDGRHVDIAVDDIRLVANGDANLSEFGDGDLMAYVVFHLFMQQLEAMNK